MRIILKLTRYETAFTKAVSCHAPRAVFGASLAIMLLLAGSLRAQTPVPTTFAQPTHLSNYGGYGQAQPVPLTSQGSGAYQATQIAPTSLHLNDAPVSTAVEQGLTDIPTVDASYSVLGDSTQVEQASLRSRAAARFAPRPQDPCNPGCDVSFYMQYDALWLRRENDERFSLSRGGFMPDFDYEFGGRYTVGHLIDCVNGWEGVYVGPYDWQRSHPTFVSAGAGLQSQLQAAGGYTAADITAFNNANTHSQVWRAQMQSLELNRRWWVWDVVSTLIGVRFVDYEEDYLFVSQNNLVGQGILTESIDNELFGVQVGGDVIYPISLRGNYGVRGKAGVYANFDDRTTFLSNAGNIVLNAGDSDVDVAGLIEVSFFGNYHITPSVRITGGYEFWWLPGMATVPEQLPSIITPVSGTRISDSDDLLLHGGSVGLQVLY